MKNDFVSFRSGVTSATRFASSDQRLRGEDRGYVLKRVQLRVNLGVHVGVAVPDADGDDAAEEIEVFVPVDVIDELVPGSRDHEGFVEEVNTAGNRYSCRASRISSFVITSPGAVVEVRDSDLITSRHEEAELPVGEVMPRHGP